MAELDNGSNSKTKLLPCPFCGSEDILMWETRIDTHVYKYQIECHECNISTCKCANEKIAVERWNTRKPVDTAIADLKKQAEQYNRRADEAIECGNYMYAGHQKVKYFSYLRAVEIVEECCKNEKQ